MVLYSYLNKASSSYSSILSSMIKDGTEITAPHDIAEAFAEVLAGIYG